MEHSTVGPRMRERGRRLRAYSFTPEFVTHIMTTGWHVGYAGEGDSIECVEGIPEGAKRVGQYYDEKTDEFVMVFEHESFDQHIFLGSHVLVGDVRFIHYTPEPERVE